MRFNIAFDFYPHMDSTIVRVSIADCLCYDPRTGITMRNERYVISPRELLGIKENTPYFTKYPELRN